MGEGRDPVALSGLPGRIFAHVFLGRCPRLSSGRTFSATQGKSRVPIPRRIGHGHRAKRGRLGHWSFAWPPPRKRWGSAGGETDVCGRARGATCCQNVANGRLRMDSRVPRPHWRRSPVAPKSITAIATRRGRRAPHAHVGPTDWKIHTTIKRGLLVAHSDHMILT